MKQETNSLSNWKKIAERVERKLADFANYNFSESEVGTFSIFFELAQEFDNADDLQTTVVAVPHFVFGTHLTLFLLDHSGAFVCSRKLPGTDECPERIWIDDEKLAHGVHVHGRDLVVPIRCNRIMADELPVPPRGNVIGALLVHEGAALREHDRLFHEKYANRVGFQMHNKFINERNKEHLNFIRTIAQDIGHNVILPNMYFKLLFRKMNRKILETQKAVTKLMGQQFAGEGQSGAEIWGEITSRLGELNEQYQVIYQHFKHTSLFLETLLRRSHFEQGRYVLMKRVCNFKTQIVEPQLDHYRPRLNERGIEVDTSMGGVPDETVELVADIGLLSQVFANLFSNAVKYTRPVRDRDGCERKFISYGWEWMPNHFGPGQRAVKINVFSTGPHVPDKDRAQLFDPDFRAETSAGEPGSGHGLSFVKQIVELHGGQVGYAATEMGNDFFIILPANGSAA
ncbi:MAG: HAMP domain-containing histidine kinase [Deltaproteobacteria bacterium]|nr:HAMP domain-containing histidine kinase [Deltaproteobacteria bacterium]